MRQRLANRYSPWKWNLEILINAHCKFIGYTATSLPLMHRAGVSFDGDEGLVQLGEGADADAFLNACGALRVWEREPKVIPEPAGLT